MKISTVNQFHGGDFLFVNEPCGSVGMARSAKISCPINKNGINLEIVMMQDNTQGSYVSGWIGRMYMKTATYARETAA